MFFLTLFFGLSFELLIGSGGYEEITYLLKSRDSDIRRKAVIALGDLKDSRATASLIETFQDSNGNVREEVATALCKIGKPAIMPLIEVLRDDNSNVREGSAKTLVNMGNAAVDLLILELNNSFSSFHNEVMSVLVTIGGSAVEPLIDMLKNESESDVKLKVVEILGKIGDNRAVEPLIGFLTYQDDIFLRWGAAVALGNIKDVRAVSPLIESLRNEEGGVRLAVLESLGKIKDKRAVEPLVDLLKKDESIQTEIIKSLANLMDDTEFESFIIAFEDKISNVSEKQ
ncbi:MAG: HEAT repeat domain-containing protein [bacterium]